MHQRFHLRDVNQRHQFLFIAVAEQIVEQFRLRGFYQLRHGDGSVHIGHCIVRIAVLNAVGAGQMLKTEAG
ncbi:hypothetical protein D3C81_1905440 [compost metagenome]